MKQFTFFSFFCLILCFSLGTNSLFAQGADDNKYGEYKKDSTVTAILASHTQSGTDCGNDPSNGDDRPHVIIIIEELDPFKFLENEGIEGPEGRGAGLQRSRSGGTTRAGYTNYLGTVNATVVAPFQENYTFEFNHKVKTPKTKIRPKWKVCAPCYVDKANISISLQYGNKPIEALPLQTKLGGKQTQNIQFDFHKKMVRLPNKKVIPYKNGFVIGGKKGKLRISIKEFKGKL